MKTLVSVTIFILCVFQSSQAQTDSVVLNKFYHTWIIPEKGQRGKSGILYEIKDSSVMVSNSPWRENYYNKNFDVTKIDIRNIKEIRVRRQGSGFAILVGGLSGMVVGGFISAAYIDHLEKTMNPFGFVFGGFLQGIIPFIVSTGIGLGVGAMVSPKIKIPIGANQNQYDRNKIKLNEYALKSNSFPALLNGKAFSKFRDSVVDIDGNVYNTLALGGQVWMAENLKVTHFRSGKEIPCIKDSAGWRMSTTAAWCNNRNDSTNVAIYGRLYNGYALTGTSGICPIGWHIPSFDEWTSLIMCLGGNDIAGGYLKEAGTSHWSNPNKTMLTDNTFALPAGNRDRKGAFTTPGHTCQWWVAKEKETDGFQGVSLTNVTTGITMIKTDNNSGLSVRCIRDN